MVSLHHVPARVSHFDDPILHPVAIQVEHKEENHPHEPQHQPEKDVGCLECEVGCLRLRWNHAPDSQGADPPQLGAAQLLRRGTPEGVRVNLSSGFVQPGRKVSDFAGAGVGVLTQEDLDIPKVLQLLESIRPECGEGVASQVQRLQTVDP